MGDKEKKQRNTMALECVQGNNAREHVSVEIHCVISALSTNPGALIDTVQHMSSFRKR